MSIFGFTNSLKIIVRSIVFLGTISQSVYAQETSNSAEDYSLFKKAIVENAGAPKSGLYEYELDFKFIVKQKFLGFSRNRLAGEAEVISKNRATLIQLENDGLDKATKTFLVTGPNSKGNESIEIIFSVLEWKNQGNYRGSEGTHLLVRNDKNGKTTLEYKNSVNEWTKTSSEIVVTPEQIRIRYMAPDSNGKEVPQLLTITRNETLDTELSIQIQQDTYLKVGSFSGGKN